MTPQEFAGLGLDVVTEFAVGFKKDPNGVTLVLRHQSLPDALRAFACLNATVAAIAREGEPR